MTGVEVPDHRAAGPNQSPLAFVSAHAWPILACAVLVSFFAFCYADVFKTLWTQWNTNEANSHGFLIPWISLYVVWVRRDRLLALRPAPVWWAGLLVLLPSLGVLLVGRLVGIVGLQEASLVGSLFGLALLITGWQGLHVLWFPIGYLLFMMPIWDMATESMYYPLQLFAAKGSARILTVIGVPVFQDRTFLQLPNMSLEVALACSGINFLMSVLAIGILLAYISLHGVWRRLALVAGSVVVALLANPVRVALIAYSYYAGITTPRQSHMWQGMLVSLACFAIVFTAGQWLGGDGPGAAANPPALARTAETRARGGRWLLLIIIACVLLLVVGLLRPLPWPNASLAGAGLVPPPARLGAWREIDRRPEVPSGLAVQPDETWTEYRNLSGQAVRVYVGRFAQPQTKGLSYWSDSFGGIAADSIDVHETGRLTVSTGWLIGSGRRTHVLFWYQAGQFATTSRALAKLHAGWCTVFGAALPTLVVMFFNGEEDASDARAVIALKDVAGQFARFVPGAAARPGSGP